MIGMGFREGKKRVSVELREREHTKGDGKSRAVGQGGKSSCSSSVGRYAS